MLIVTSGCVSTHSNGQFHGFVPHEPPIITRAAYTAVLQFFVSHMCNRIQNVCELYYYSGYTLTVKVLLSVFVLTCLNSPSLFYEFAMICTQLLCALNL